MPSGAENDLTRRRERLAAAQGLPTLDLDAVQLSDLELLLNGGFAPLDGFLGEAAKGDAYPLMSAKDAFEGMPAMGRPDICMLPKDGSTGCAEPEPVEITGAELGLSLQTTKDGKYTVEFVECLASCGTAPVMMCNEDFYEGVSNTKADEILGKCQ